MKKLIPVGVPWMVAPAIPKLTISSTEEGDTIVTFVGLFGYESASEGAAKGAIVDASEDIFVNPDETSSRYQLISIRFDTAGWVRRSPQYSDREVIRESDFDWSMVSGAIRAGEAVIDWRTRVSADWAETKICPNPCVYVVENSDWDVGLERDRLGLMHFLVLGESSYVEVMARGFVWCSHGNVTR